MKRIANKHFLHNHDKSLPTCCGVPPGVETGDGAVGDQEICMSRDLVAEGVRVRLGGAGNVLQLDAAVELVALAGLSKK